MSSDASTLPLRERPLRRSGGLLGSRAGAADRLGADARLGALALALIVLGCALIVLLAADRPSILVPNSHPGYFPRWMAGPLGGLWPSLPRDGDLLRYLFSGAVLVMYASYAAAIRYAPRLPARWAIGAVLAVHLLLVLSPPLALNDVFNYINYGRMEVVHNLNPYASVSLLEPHGDPSFALSNWHRVLSPYGPLFTLMSFALVPLGIAGSFWMLKGIVAACSLGILLLVWKSARLLGRDPVAAILLVGLNPVTLVWGLGGAHSDYLMVVLVVLALYLLLRAGALGALPGGPTEHRTPVAGLLLPLAPLEIGAGVALLSACAIKATAVLLVPVLLAGLVRTPRRLAQVLLGMAAAGTVVAAVILIAFGGRFPDLSIQNHVVTLFSVPNLLGLLVGVGGESNGIRVLMDVALIGALLLCCRLAVRRRDVPSALAWASLAPLLTLAWVFPWYVLWALPLAALASSRRVRMAVLAVGLYLIVAWAPASSLAWHAIGFHPESTALGQHEELYVRRLLH